MSSVALALLAFAVLPAAVGSLSLADAARIYARRSLIDDSSYANLENSPRIDAALRWPTMELGLGYEPRLTFVDVFGNGPSPGLWLHSAAGRFAVRAPRYTLSFSQSATVGEQDFSQSGGLGVAPPSTPVAAPSAQTGSTTPGAPQPMLTGTTPASVALLPNARAVRVADEQTAASFTYEWTRRWHSDVKATFGFSGGSTAMAQQLLPRQRRAQLDSALAFDLSRRDEVRSLLSGAQIATSNGYDHWLATLSETWSTQWTAHTSSAIAAGAAFQHTTAPDGDLTQRASPIGSASVAHGWRQRAVQMRLQAGVAYAPEVNVLIGRLQNRLQLSSQASVTAARLTVSLLAAAAQTLPASAPDAATIANAALYLDYAFLEWLAAQAGGQLVRQNLGGQSARTTWLLYAGLTAQAPEVRF